MVSEHAMLILILLLAVAVVILAVGLMYYAAKTERRLCRLIESIEHSGANGGLRGPSE